MDDTQSRYPDATPAPFQSPPAPGAYPPPGAYPGASPSGSPAFPPQPEPRRMSRGAKWGLGIGIALVVLTLLACPVILFVGALGGESVVMGDGIAVIHVEGVIAGTGSIYDGIVSPEYMLDQLDQALADPNVKAILLRIDSPGGTVAASQEISLAVRRAAAEKPIVASIGDIGASGAYMVASQCDEIVASPGSTVGSIGVIMEVPNVAGLLDKLGVEFTVLTQGEHKDVGSPYRSMTATETVMLEGQMEIAYEQFVADVALGRGMDEADVRELATGWAWLAAEAVDLGLVDTLGNYDDAVERAADLGGIEGTPAIISYEPDFTFTDLVFSLIGLATPLDGPDAEAIERLGLPR